MMLIFSAIAGTMGLVVHEMMAQLRRARGRERIYYNFTTSPVCCVGEDRVEKKISWISRGKNYTLPEIWRPRRSC